MRFNKRDIRFQKYLIFREQGVKLKRVTVISYVRFARHIVRRLHR
jgi:hypothetical protein